MGAAPPPPLPLRLWLRGRAERAPGETKRSALLLSLGDPKVGGTPQAQRAGAAHAGIRWEAWGARFARRRFYWRGWRSGHLPSPTSLAPDLQSGAGRRRVEVAGGSPGAAVLRGPLPSAFLQLGESPCEPRPFSVTTQCLSPSPTCIYTLYTHVHTHITCTDTYLMHIHVCVCVCIIL